MKKVNLKIALFTVLMLFVGVGFSSCDKMDNEPIAPQQNQDNTISVFDASEMRSIGLQGDLPWEEQDLDHPDGLRYYKLSYDGREFFLFKVYLPKIIVSPVYNILSTSKGVNNPTFKKQDITNWSASYPSYAMINASFFNQDKYSVDYGPVGTKAELAHILGFNNRYISKGYDPKENNVKYLKILDKKAYVSSSTSHSSFELLVGGLDVVKANKEKASRIGRTVIGIERNGTSTLYCLITRSANQTECEAILRTLGCSEFIMLDGSGSSQAVWNGEEIVESTDTSRFPYFARRNIPVVLRFNRR